MLDFIFHSFSFPLIKYPDNLFFGKFIFWKIIKIILIYLLAPFIKQIFKKFFQGIQSYEDAQFLDPKWPICLNEKTC